MGNRSDFIFGSGSILALAFGNEATDQNLPKIFNKRQIEKQVKVEDLSHRSLTIILNEGGLYHWSSQPLVFVWLVRD